MSFFCFSQIVLQPETVIDMKQRYVGHCNVGTDIKQASFLGERGIQHLNGLHVHVYADTLSGH